MSERTAEPAIDPITDLLTENAAESTDPEREESRPLGDYASTASVEPILVHVPAISRDAVIVGRPDGGIRSVHGHRDLAVLLADTIAGPASGPDAANLPRRALVAFANWHHDLFSEIRRLHTELESTRRDHGHTLASIRDYAIQRHKEGRYCRAGLYEALRTFGLDEYEPTFRVTYTITGTYDVTADSAPRRRTRRQLLPGARTWRPRQRRGRLRHVPGLGRCYTPACIAAGCTSRVPFDGPYPSHRPPPYAMDEHAQADLRDVDALAAWFRRRLHPPALARFGDDTVAAATQLCALRRQNANQRRRSIEPIVDAAVAAQAVELLTSPDHELMFARLTPLIRQPGQMTARKAPVVVSRRRISALTPGLQARLLTASDAHLAGSDRLRYRTCTNTPRLTRPDSTVSADRARHLPQYLWLDWIIRLRPAHGSFADTIGTDIPAALIIPGNPTPNLQATTELTARRNNSSRTIRLLGEQYPDALTAICALAHYLDTHGSPIDYRRRRATFTDVPLDRRQWEELCYAADAHPGKAARHLNARRYIFALLTGADLANPDHPLAFPTASDKHDYLSVLQRTLSTPLRDALHEHATNMLHAAGIDEPLTWSTPADCVAGLRLPGRDPDDIDLDAVRRLVVVNGLTATTAAQQLDVSVDHIRYALQHLHRPGKTNGKNTPPASRRLRERAAALLTAEFLQREYLEAGKDLRTIEQETGIHRKLIAEHAKLHDIPLIDVRHLNKPIPIDPDWLREQSETRQRSCSDIAAELGLTPETVRRNLIRLGITRRPQGFAGIPAHASTYPELPDGIRRIVEGPHHGWLRLRRFQQIMAYPSLNTAAKGIGSHLGTLLNQVQRLEADIGKPLLNRGRPFRPMSPTEHGQALLDQLRQPNIAALLDRYAKPNRGWRPDDPRRHHQSALRGVPAATAKTVAGSTTRQV